MWENGAADFCSLKIDKVIHPERTLRLLLTLKQMAVACLSLITCKHCIEEIFLKLDFKSNNGAAGSCSFKTEQVRQLKRTLRQDECHQSLDYA